MFDRLIEFLIDIIDQVLPLKIVRQDQQAVLFRFGKFREIKYPGTHLKIPFFDDIEVHTVVRTTLTLPPQSVTTADGKSVVIRAQIKYKVLDLSIYGVQVWDAKDALSDMTGGIIYNAVRTHDFDQLRTMDLDRELTQLTRPEAKTWGIEIFKVTVTDLAEMKSYRLFTEKDVLN